MSNNRELIIYAAIGGVGAAAGFGGGYLVAKKRHERIANEEIASVKHTYSQMLQEKPDLESLAERYEDDIADAEEVQEIVADLVEQVGVDRVADIVTPNEFVDPEAEAVQQQFEAEQATKNNVLDQLGDEKAAIPTQDKPYIISNESWSEASWDHHDKTTLTYYAKDDTLADEADEMYDDIDGLVGKTNITRFGYLSEDPDIVYVRNERIAVDFEITRNDGSYFDIVHGNSQE